MMGDVYVNHRRRGSEKVESIVKYRVGSGKVDSESAWPT
jgi:hypothetical protein